jgi:hypothetical protein
VNTFKPAAVQTDHPFPIRKAGIFRSGQEIKECAEAYDRTPHKLIPQIDTARAKKHPSRMETAYISSPR